MKILDILFPQNIKCIVCSCEIQELPICDKCLEKLPFIKGKTCSKCGGMSNDDICFECKSHDTYVDKCYSVFEYKDIIKQKIIEFKQGSKPYIGEVFSDLMLKKFKTFDKQFDFIIPIPIHINRLKQRGFNQSEILCKDINEYYGRVSLDTLIRIKDTPHQTGLSRDNRRVNLNSAFKVSPKRVKNKIILLVDDIYTTGSTLNECAKILKKSGALKVYALCLARTPVSANIFENIEEINKKLSFAGFYI